MALPLVRRSHLYPALLFCSVGVLIAVGVVATWNMVQLVTTIRYQQDRMEFKNELTDIRKVLQQLDANEQYFYVTGNDEYFERLGEALPDLKNERNQLINILKKQENRGRDVEVMGYLLNRKVELVEDYLLERKLGQNKLAIIRQLNSRANKQLSRDLRSVLTAIDLSETQAISDQDIIVDKYSLLSMIAIVVGLCIAIALVAIFGWRSWREIDRRARTEIDLLKAQDAAVVSSRLKSQFLATVSHEIRTPLNGIIGLSDLLREQAANAEEKRLANIIHSSGRSLLRIVNDILDFSKIEAGKIELEIQKFNLRSIIQSSLELHSLKARSKGLLLLSHLDKDMPTSLLGDSERLTQVLNNLIGNAVKFTEYGEITVLGKILREDSAKIYIQFSVADTGIGIPASEQGHIFQPFNQVNSANTAKNEGTGLGLSISKNIIEKMGGSIRLESQESKGSKFIFEVPFDKAGSERLKDSFPKINFQNILYVGVNKNVCAILERYASDTGLRFYTSKTTVELNRSLNFLMDRQKTACFYHLEDYIVAEEEFSESIKGFCLINDNSALLTNRKINKSSIVQMPLSRSKFMEALSGNLRFIDMNSENAKSHYKSRSSSNGADESLVILVVEDNATNQILAQSYLEKFGFRTHLASNGVEAMAALEHANYDVILMDCRMPVMDGFEATRQIRNIESSKSRRTPIIAMTANAMEGDKDRCISAGMDDYLSKPFEPQELLQIIKKWVGGTRQIDTSVLESLSRKTNAEVVYKMSKSFLTTLSDGLSILEKALKEGDLEPIRFQAHKLKSSSAALGASQLANLCSLVEEQVDTGNLIKDNVSELIQAGKLALAEMTVLVGHKEKQKKTTSDDSPRQ